MKKSSFIEGTVIATTAIVLVKILGMLYVIPFYAMIGIKGSALYAYAYNIYIIFLDISTAGFPIALSKLINEYNTLGKMEAKVRTYYLGRKILIFISIGVFLLLMLFAKPIASLLLGDLRGGNTIADVTFVIRCVSFAILVVPFLCVSRGYLQGHKIIRVSSVSQLIEQVIRIVVILGGSYLVLDIFNLSLTSAIGVAVLGAFFGGIAAYIYILGKMRNYKKEIGLGVKYDRDSITDKEIIKKIFTYAIPFIITNGIASLYNFVDMTLILRTMNYLKFSALDVEFIASAITTWAPKINMIITSMAMGMTISLIPTIVSAYALKNWPEINNKINQALQVILFISIPMAVGISLLSKPVWSIFYGTGSQYGPIILSVSVFMCVLLNLYIVVGSTLQGLNKFKLVYKTTLFGFVTNALLDVPIMLLYNRIGIPPFLGALTASIIGYTVSVLIALILMKKEHQLNYNSTWKVFFKTLLPTGIMLIMVLITKSFIPLNLDSKLSCLIFISINAFIGAIGYILIAYKTGIIKSILGQKLIDKIINKITFGKIKSYNN